MVFVIAGNFPERGHSQGMRGRDKEHHGRHSTDLRGPALPAVLVGGIESFLMTTRKQETSYRVFS